MAWIEIASLLLYRGTTSHRIWKLPLTLTDNMSSNFKTDLDKEKIKNCDVFLWKEASMIPLKALEFADKIVRDICNNDTTPFAGKLLILGGDFRQLLPVIKNATKEKILDECIKNSELWTHFKILKLSKNMRSENEDFQKFLLNIGDGNISSMKIPDEWLTNDICSTIYGKELNTENDLTSRIILCCHNNDVNNINNKILSKLNTEEKTYYSVDYISHKGSDLADEKLQLDYPIEEINKIKIPGLPFHELKLKIGAIVILLRNLNLHDGLCNGTRMKVTELYEFNIKVMILTGTSRGKMVFIPKILMDSQENSLPFILNRRQFPIALAFAITINKSQGQSFDHVGIFYRRSLFSHGQLYVALSRCRHPNNLFIENASEYNEIQNIVWKEILRK